MREIKFRVYDCHCRVMEGPKGLSISFDNGIITSIWFRESDYSSRGSSRYPLDQERYKVMQFTGRKDRDGTEIYEGDIVEFYGYGEDSDWTERTPQSRDVVTMEFFPLGWLLFARDPDLPHECKVVGNIYQTEPCDQKGCEHEPIEHFLFDTGLAGLRVDDLNFDQRVHWLSGYSVFEMNQGVANG